MKSVLPLLAAAALPAQPFAASADVIFHDGFESPPVTGRTPKAAGGDPSKPDPANPGKTPAWSRFEDQPNLGEAEGRIVAGLTDQAARTGRQALFVEATRLSAPFLGALFITRPIRVEGGACYKACIWGCNDPVKPLGSPAQLFFKIQVDFFSDDGKTEVGESQYLLQPLPGGKDRPPLLLSTEWRPVAIRFTAPAQARTMTLSFRCDSRAEKGTVTGAVFWDDITVETDPPRAPEKRDF
ncbi:MAG: hypothetical protein PHQ12_09010 [Chthoniobacteraceae bacterium]|nr:hypothetical protein [Chthoniobacteraceae bacterium]